MRSKFVSFLAPSALVFLGFAVLVGVAYSPLMQEQGPLHDFVRPRTLEPEQLPDLGADQLLLPSPQLSPSDVVQTQLDGLADPDGNGVGILQCYCFASPGNRAVTGPLDRFGQMVRQGPFACLGQPRATLVGEPQVDGRLAKLLVTVVDQQQMVHVFTFILFKQLDPPFKDCWMTEGVYPFGQLGDQPEPAQPQPPLAGVT
jgi:hypothetical protein